MDIDPSDPTAHQRVAIDKVQHLRVFGNRHLLQSTEEHQNLAAVLEIAARQFANDELVARYTARSQMVRKAPPASPQVIHPDGRVSKSHLPLRLRRRGLLRSRRSDPPSAARRCALSRAISASSPARTSADFS